MIIAQASPKKFTEIFSCISIDHPIQKIFEQVYIEQIKVYKKARKLEIFLVSSQIIHPQVIEKIQQVLENDYYKGVQIGFELRYTMDIISSSERFIHLYWDSLVYTLGRITPLTQGAFLGADWKVLENEILRIQLKNNTSFILRKKQIDKLIEEILNKHLIQGIRVKLLDERLASESQEDYFATKGAIENELIQNIVSSMSMNAKIEQRHEKSPENIVKDVNEIILGKRIQGEKIRINEVTPESGSVIVEGELLSIEEREIKGERYILSCDITDLSNSITIKFFLKKEKYEEVRPRLRKGNVICVQGEAQFDKYANELVIMVKDISEGKKIIRMDHSKEKRVELHVHTKMSAMDAITSAKDLIAKAALWGHKAIAITDHGVLQAYPEAMDAAKKHGIKVIYGVEAYLVDDNIPVVLFSKNQHLEDTYVVFDLETTGLSPLSEKVTEIGAVKVRNGLIIDRFSTFVNPQKSIPDKIVELTGITDDMVKGAPTIEEVLPKFLEFCEDTVLVAHNAGFDTGFIKYFARQQGLVVNQTILDTVELSRTLFPELKRYKLNLIAKHLGITLDNHHRAVDDAEATAEIFIKMIGILKEKDIYTLDQVNELAKGSLDIKKIRPTHAIILVKNQVGLKNLYKLVSHAHLDYFYRKPRIPKSLLIENREGLILGSACEAGELYRSILNGQPDDKIAKIVEFYDYLEIQPLGNNQFLLEDGQVQNEEMLKEINRKIIALGKQYEKPVVATCDVHFMEPHEEVYRRILLAAQKFSDADRQPPLYLRTTEEMLEEFSYLGQELAYEVVVTNTNLIADEVEMVKPIPDETYPPKIDGAEEQIAELTWNRVKELYEHEGEIPDIVKKRAEKELNSIIKNGFSVMYIIAQKLVWKSLEDGYLVGSRGSVGSSFVATMIDITEVNPLPAHYVCPKCKYSEWPEGLAGKSGCDMPDKDCPKCGTSLAKDGHDIPFETFLGFDGDKEPDIDLNFSGEYQPNAHKYTEVLFGKGYTFRAGTIGTMAEKTAYGFVKKYLDERGLIASNAEINRLVLGCTGVKRTSGQHPGGIMVVPSDNEIFNFCPIQRPADDVNSEIITTHFDYHSISGRLLKLDILGHDDPTMIRMLQDLTGVNPREIPLGDPEVMSLFTSTQALKINAEDIFTPVGALGLPEFGTKFVRQMLIDTKPTTFSELIQISGLSHGTDVWLNNAQDLIKVGTCELKDTICTRDDIMTYLIDKGVEPKTAFFIMEKVRKGKGLSPDDEVVMKNQNVPQWYIDSCNKIKYMFPKAHAAAYVMMAIRIAYFKVYYPEAYYATYFTVRADDFDYELMCQGQSKVKRLIQEYYNKGNTITTKEKNVLTILEVVNEMYARGIRFLSIDLYKSHASKFQIIDGDLLLPPFNTLPGLGGAVAENMMKAREDGEYLSLEEFRQRTKASKTICEMLKQIGCLEGIPETNQLSLF